MTEAKEKSLGLFWKILLTPQVSSMKEAAGGINIRTPPG